MSATPDRALQLAAKKPRLALFLATGFGLGYLPLAPGTWGSLLGVVFALSLRRVTPRYSQIFIFTGIRIGPLAIDQWAVYSLVAILGVAAVGVWASGAAARYFGHSDPRKVVLDEVSGQMIALLGTGWNLQLLSRTLSTQSHFLALGAPNWKYLLLGLILFRVFDIWKPFPARQAEHLPGGWGIMADDWVAAIYAAVGLWLARALGL